MRITKSGLVLTLAGSVLANSLMGCTSKPTYFSNPHLPREVKEQHLDKCRKENLPQLALSSLNIFNIFSNTPKTEYEENVFRCLREMHPDYHKSN
jgi:hypothetical protein